MVRRIGGTQDEISAMAWSIMAYWRLNYDHTSIPYHSLHEIMDFTPEFGLNYDPENRFNELNLFTQEGLILSLQLNIMKNPDDRDIQKLIDVDTPLNVAQWFMDQPSLWSNSIVFEFLKTTNLSDKEYKTLNPENVFLFFRIHEDARTILDDIGEAKTHHILLGQHRCLILEGNEDAVDALIGHDSAFNVASWFLAKPELWKIQPVMDFLTQTSLPIDEFRKLNREDLGNFFQFNSVTKAIFRKLDSRRKQLID